MAQDFLLYFALKYDGDFDKIVDALNAKERFSLQEYNAMIKTKQYKHVTALNENYPEFLKLVECPPLTLFYQGNLELLEETNLPIRYSVLEHNDKRFITTLCPDLTKDGEIVLDYIVMAESQNDLTMLLDRMKESKLPFKNYEKHKVREQER